MRPLFVLPLLIVCWVSGPVSADTALERRVRQLERQVDHVQERAPLGIVLVLFGAFCALWAQNTGRNAWLWFFLGLIFSVITVFVLLYKNALDRTAPRRLGR